MRTDGKMSYKDFVFPVNPSFIQISHDRQVVQQKIPYASSEVFELGEKSRVISGEGEFYGSEYEKSFDRLKKIFDEGGGGMLYIPSQKPVYAVFESLELIGRDIEGVIKYSFRFIESFDKNRQKSSSCIFADGKHSLWDYSYEKGINIEELAGFNPEISRPDIILPAGRKVKLC